MNGVGAGLPDRIEDLVDDDIGLVGWRRADMHRLIGHLDMQRIAVGIGIDGDRLDAELLRGLDDPAGNSPRLAMRIFWIIVVTRQLEQVGRRRERHLR